MGDVVVGIDNVNVYAGVASIEPRLIFEGRGLQKERLSNLQVDRRGVQLPWEDPVTNAVNAAGPLLDRLSGPERDSIELLIVATESGLDYSKSLSSWVHEQLGLSRRCRMFEIKQACYGATAAVQMAASMVRERVGARALVIGTDVSPMDEKAGYAETTTGHGAVAVLVAASPRVLQLKDVSSGLHSFNIMDTCRPRADFDLYDPDASLLAYMECFMNAYADFCRLNGLSAQESHPFDRLVMHTPFVGMARAAHRRLSRMTGMRSASVIEEDFLARVWPSTAIARETGNLCAGSVFAAVASLAISGFEDETLDVGCFSYGSGCASEFFAGEMTADAGKAVGQMLIPEVLGRRDALAFDQYVDLVHHSRQSLVAKENIEVDLDNLTATLRQARPDTPTLVLHGVKGHRRLYEWH